MGILALILQTLRERGKVNPLYSMFTTHCEHVHSRSRRGLSERGFTRLDEFEHAVRYLSRQESALSHLRRDLARRLVSPVRLGQMIEHTPAALANREIPVQSAPKKGRKDRKDPDPLTALLRGYPFTICCLRVEWCRQGLIDIGSYAD